MKNYILKVDNRRPLKFSGEILGKYPNCSESEIIESLKKDRIHYDNQTSNLNQFDVSSLALTLYRTENKKFVLQTEKYVIDGYDSARASINHSYKPGTLTKSSKANVTDSFPNLVKSLTKKNGEIGKFSTELLENVVKKYPEYTEDWVEVID